MPITPILQRLVAVAALAVASAASAATPVRYMLWDATQLPGYQACAKSFEAHHPDIQIRITQAGWADYWTVISTGIVSGTAPDVFANHPARYPELMKNGQLVDLAPFIRRDGFDPTPFVPGLFAIWGRDGRQYGLPKDWDTIALAVNMDVAQKAGVGLAELQNMTWNAVDGGSFEQVVRRLTFDVHGNNAASPAFDRKRIAIYGYQNPGPGGMFGQTEWSHFAASSGFQLQDKAWDARLHYDDPRLAATLSYLAGLPQKGLSAPFELTRSLGSDAMFVARKAAMVPQGSWMISYVSHNAKFAHAWVRLPIGPTGQRASMLNGLADSIWIGSRVKEEAWQWVRFMASSECQEQVAQQGVVFPSIERLAPTALDAFRRHGVDAAAFVAMSKSHTFAAPIADHGSEITEAVATGIESVLIGKSAAAPTMQAVDRDVRAILGQ